MKSLPPPVVSVANAAASGALTLLRPADWRPAARRAYIWLPGAMMAGGVLWATRPGRKTPEPSGAAAAAATAGAAARPAADPAAAEETDSGEARKSLAARASVALTAAVIGAAVMAGYLKVDAGIERWLVGRGVPHARRWMAAGVTAAALAMDAATAPSDAGRGTTRDQAR